MALFGKRLLEIRPTNNRPFFLDISGKGANQAVAAAKLGSKTAMIAKVRLCGCVSVNFLITISVVFAAWCRSVRWQLQRASKKWKCEHGTCCERRGSGKFILLNAKYEAWKPIIELIRKAIFHRFQCYNHFAFHFQTTGIAQISVADNGDNQIVVVLGANDTLTLEDVDNSREFIDNAKVMVCQMETPVRATLAALRRFKGISILNASPPPQNNSLDIYTVPNILCINEHEAGSLTQRDVPDME